MVMKKIKFNFKDALVKPLITFQFLVKVDVVPLKDIWDEVILESINSMSEDVLNYKNLTEIKKFLNS